MHLQYYRFCRMDVLDGTHHRCIALKMFHYYCKLHYELGRHQMADQQYLCTVKLGKGDFPPLRRKCKYMHTNT